MPDSSLPLPDHIGRYQVERELGSGAMGRVLLARDPVLERHVAIKLLRADLAIPSDMRAGLLVRMRHEARAAARVTHPNLVVLHDMGEDDKLGLFLVFEYLEGPTLKQALARGAMAPRRAAKLALELGDALSFAHERDVLHRDVKPDNIILTPVGAKIADFGIARVPDSTLTFAGGLLGTPAYSAPETFRESKFSPASDAFSLAATLYEAVSGQRAFPGDDAVSVASKITHEEFLPFAESLKLPAEVDAVFRRGLAKRAEDRYLSARELGVALVAALGVTPEERIEVAVRRSQSDRARRASDDANIPTRAGASMTSSGPSRLPPSAERRPPVLAIIAIFVLAAVLVLAFRWFVGRQDDALSGTAEPSASAPNKSVVPKKPRAPLPTRSSTSASSSPAPVAPSAAASAP